MVQQLTDFYHSLETRVEERTRQMRLATSVAQDAVAAPSRYEILQRATKLLVEQFNFLFAAIYLVDENNENAILTEQSGSDPEEKTNRVETHPRQPGFCSGMGCCKQAIEIGRESPRRKVTSTA